jgi:hypothetical protein
MRAAAFSSSPVDLGLGSDVTPTTGREGEADDEDEDEDEDVRRTRLPSKGKALALRS